MCIWITAAVSLTAAAAVFGITWVVMKSGRAVLEERLKSTADEIEKVTKERDFIRNELDDLRSRYGRLETQAEQARQKNQEMESFVRGAIDSLRDTFKGLSADTLAQNSEQFLKLAKATFETYHARAQGDLVQRQKAVEELVKPLSEALERVSTHVNEAEKSRKQAYGAISQQVEALLKSQEKLKAETGNLVQALRKPSVRGRWGEIQLRRVVEYAGMLPYCDFLEQPSVMSDDGRLRPDMLVKLPGGKQVIVDSKAPLEAYLSAISAEDEPTRREFMADHARQIRRHMQQLSAKEYWRQFEDAPEFVVMFLPGETFFIAALEYDESIVRFGVDNRVILATPTTLIALLQAVAYGWQQEKLAENARQIKRLGTELYHRLSKLAEHFGKVGKSLDGAVKSYNAAVGSLESMVLPAARRFPELGGTKGDKIKEVEPVDKTTRDIKAPELLNGQNGRDDDR